jgi:L-iditol 2-dehydrogenase
MRALVKYAKGPGLTELRDVPVPEPKPGEVLVKVIAAAVCASDVHLVHDRFMYVPPLVLGHEFSGIVEKLGDGVKNVKPGDLVVSENNPQACGKCPICRDGFPNMCPEKKAIGFKRDGCFAEYVAIPAELLHIVPEGVDPIAASLSEPLAVAVHSVEDRGAVKPDEYVVIMGPGAIGLLCAQVARAEGAGTVLLAGTSKDEALRLTLARKLGFETCVVDKEDLSKKVMAATGGYGADMVVDAAGAAPAIISGINILRRCGRLIATGITGRDQFPVPWDAMVSKALTVQFTYSSRRRNWEKAMQYLAGGRVDALSLVTQRMPLEKWEEAFALLERMESIRTVLEIG